MYNVKDNAETRLQFGISSIATNITVEEGTASVFPVPPFIAVLNKRDENGGIIKSEKIEVTGIDGDNLTIVRGFEESEKLDFNAGDYISLFVMARHIQDLQEGLEEILHDISNEGLVKPATEETNGTVRIATTEQINNVVNKDDHGVFLMPKVSDLVQEYIGATFISASNITVGADTYIYEQPDIDECSKEFYIGKDNNNKILDIQGISNGRGFDLVSLKLSKAGLPTTKLIIELMSASINGNFWKGDTVLARGELTADEITETGSYTVQLDRTVNLSLGTPFVIRLRQTDNIANVMNYYSVYGHPAHNSDIFSGNYIVGESIVNTLNDIYFECTGKITQAIRQDTNGRLDYIDTYRRNQAEVVASGFSYPFNISSPDIDPAYPITLSGTIQFVQHSNNGATLYSSDPGQGWMQYLGEESNKVRDLYANGRTYTITMSNKPVTISDLENGIIEIVRQSSLSTWDHRWAECYFTISWDLVLNFTDINSGGDVQEIYIRNNAYRLGLVSATIIGKHIDGSFIYPKNDGSHAVIAGQKGDNGKEVILKVEDKCFYYKYDGDLNWNRLSSYYDFIGPSGPRGLEGPRGPMGGINYRGTLNSVSDLPEEGEIEGEAYSINGVLYIWNGTQFTNSDIPASSITFCTDWENIQNKPDIVRISDEVAYQISQGNYDYVWRLTERLYTQINLLAKDLNLTAGEDINQLCDLWYGKLISHDYLYNNYVVPSTYASSYLNRNNTNYLFQLSNLFYNNLNYINSSLNFTDGDTFIEMIDLPQEMAKFWNSSLLRESYYDKSSYAKTTYGVATESKVVKIILACLGRDTSSYSTFATLFANGTIDDEILANVGCFHAICNNVGAYTAMCSSSTFVNKLFQSPTMLQITLTYPGVLDELLSNSVSQPIALQNDNFMYTLISSDSGSATLAGNQDILADIASNYSYAAVTFRHVDVMKTDLWNAFQTQSYKLYNTLNSNLTVSNYYSSDRDHGELSGASKIDFINQDYSFGTKALVFPAYYWDDGDSTSQQLRMLRWGSYYMVGYPERDYGSSGAINVIAGSSDAKPMGFGVDKCRLVNLGGSNYGMGVSVFTIPTE